MSIRNGKYMNTSGMYFRSNGTCCSLEGTRRRTKSFPNSIILEKRMANQLSGVKR